MDVEKYTDIEKYTEESYPASSIVQLILKTQPPYTPSQREKLQKDILGHKLEGEIASNEEMPDEEWMEAVERVTEASDEELDRLWGSCAEWILSRRDIPIEDNDPIAQAIRKAITDEDSYLSRDELAVANPTLIHQRYKRFTESLSPDYGFLPSVYHSIKNVSDAASKEPTNTASRP